MLVVKPLLLRHRTFSVFNAILCCCIDVHIYKLLNSTKNFYLWEFNGCFLFYLVIKTFGFAVFFKQLDAVIVAFVQANETVLQNI